MLDDIELRTPAFPIAENVSGTLVRRSDELKDAAGAPRDLAGAVGRDAQALAAAGATTFLEAGPGDVLTKMAKRVVPGATALAVGTPEAAAAAVSSAP